MRVASRGGKQTRHGDADLARAVRAASDENQRRAAESMVARVCALFDPPLVMPDGHALDVLVDELDGLGDHRDIFRRARGATAAQLLRRAEYQESLYEALHAHPARRSEAIAEARAALSR